MLREFMKDDLPDSGHVAAGFSLRPHKRNLKVAATSECTIPESPETLEAQLRMMTDGKRMAVLLTPGCELPEIPAGFELCATELGIFVYNPELLNTRLILESIDKGEVGFLLGYGVPSKPKEAIGAVTIRSRNGVEKQSVVVDDHSIEDAIHAAAEKAAPGDTVALETDGKVLADRIRDLTERDLKSYPVTSAALKQQVEAAAKANGNSLGAPTHYLERNGEIVGALRLQVLPVAAIWLHTEKIRAHDSLEFVRVLCGSLSMAGHHAVAVVINRDSPFLKVKERFGFMGNDNDVMAIKIL